MARTVSERMFAELFDVFWESTFKDWLYYAEGMGSDKAVENLLKTPEEKQKPEMKFLFNLFYKFLIHSGLSINDMDRPCEGGFYYLLKKNIKQSTQIDLVKRRFAYVQAELKAKNNKPAKPEGSLK